MVVGYYFKWYKCTCNVKTIIALIGCGSNCCCITYLLATNMYVFFELNFGFFDVLILVLMAVVIR